MGENSRGPIHPALPAQPNKSKEPILMGESDPSTDDELSSGISPFLYRSPPQNNAEAESKKRPPCQPSWFVSAWAAGYEERPTETDAIRNWPPNMCLSGLGVWLLHFCSCITHSRQPPSRIRFLFRLSGGQRICYPHPLAHIF